MPKNSEAIRLAEASDWKGLQRLIEMAPEYAHEVGDYGMLPIHWACTESHVPAALLAQLLAAFPDGAKIKNDAELLPLHIAIRARVEPEWLEQLVDVYPNAVHVDAPDGVSVMELADQVGLHSDGVKILQRAVEDSLPENDDRRGHYSAAAGRPERDEDWQAPRKQPLLSKVAPLVDGLPANFGRGSNSNNNTPVSPAESLRSISSDGNGELEPQHRHMGRLISPTSSSSSTGSANTAPIPRTAPPLPSRLNASFRKHSLDYLAHAAAAAAAARQHQEMLQRGGAGIATQPQRSMSMLSGRHQSLPMIPSFEHVKLAYPHPHDQYDDQSSEEEEGNNLTYHHSAGGLPREALGDGARTFESPPEWKRDDECSICRASFGMFKHRHHCRNCGKSICSQHSADKKIMMESKGFTTPQRVCVTCYAMITHKQSKEATVQPSPLDGLLQGAKITGPVAAFHQQIQQQHHAPHPHPQVQSARRTSATGFMGISSPGSAGQRSARSSMTVPTMHSSPVTSGSMSSNGARDAASDHWAMQVQMNELRHIVASQQKHIEQLTQTNMQMQQQILEQEELKAETMLLITQLMTRVSVLELNRHDDDDQEEDDDPDGPYDDDDAEADESLRRHLSG